ncbi:MAG: T9SS type A sorting domain-containing protein [Bacteroidia bacterium]
MKKTLLCIIFLLSSLFANSQRHDANWVLGGEGAGIHANVIIEFDTAGPVNYSVPLSIASMALENASISDASGNLLFLTNGIRLYNRNMDTIPNGELALPTILSSVIPYGLNQRQGCMFLPWPGDSNLYALLHTTYDYTYPPGHPAATGLPLPLFLYLTVLDKNLNGGLGGVVYKNIPVLNDTMTRSGGGLSVTRHANGRDWWIVMKKHYRNRYYKLLLTPSGISLQGFQLLGPDSTKRYGELYIFSPDGNILAGPVGENTAIHPLAIMDFDRCSGTLSNFQLVYTPPTSNYGCEDIDFSSNSRYLYANERVKVFQFDVQDRTTSGAIQNSMIQVVDTAWTTETCDSGYVGGKLFYAFGGLAPDKRLYYFTIASCNELTYLEYPDSSGLLSSMNYAGLNFPGLHTGGVPYFPNYRLGPVVGSVCDSLTAIHELQPDEVSLYPNPAKDHITVQSIRSLSNAEITLMNVQGQVLSRKVFGFGNNFELDLPCDMGNGIYFLRIHSTEGAVSKKVVVQR